MAYVKRDNQNNIIGVFNLPQSDAKEFLADDDSALQAFINRPAPQSVNKLLEDAFLSVLPIHIGQPYLTPQVIAQIASVKQSVTDFNRLGLYDISKQIIQSLDLPEQMQEAKTEILSMFP